MIYHQRLLFEVTRLPTSLLTVLLVLVDHLTVQIFELGYDQALDLHPFGDRATI